MENNKYITGSFSYRNDKLDFTCHTKGAEFKEVLQAITAVRNECQRQIDNQQKCPFYKKEANSSTMPELNDTTSLGSIQIPEPLRQPKMRDITEGKMLDSHTIINTTITALISVILWEAGKHIWQHFC